MERERGWLLLVFGVLLVDWVNKVKKSRDGYEVY